MKKGPDTPPVACRFESIDALRGAAMVWMAAFHFAFDLSHFGWMPAQDFYRDPLWTFQRVAIVSLFLFTAGVGQAMAQAQGQAAQRFWRRWGQIAGCAVLVSLGSWVMFPQSWISFGVLHGMAVMLLLLRLSGHAASGLLVGLAAVALVLPWAAQHSVFDSRWANWVGLVTVKPRTEDYVPLLPWFGALLLGVVAGRRWLAVQSGRPGMTVPRWLKPLVSLGRWPLSFYMLHQPVLIGAVAGVTHLMR